MLTWNRHFNGFNHDFSHRINITGFCQVTIITVFDCFRKMPYPGCQNRRMETSPPENTSTPAGGSFFTSEKMVDSPGT